MTFSSTFLPTTVPFATLTGLVHGSTRASEIKSKDEKKEEQAFLKSLQKIAGACEVLKTDSQDIDGLEILDAFLADDGFSLIQGTANSVANLVNWMIQIAATLLTHATQLPSDSSIALNEALTFFANILKNTDLKSLTASKFDELDNMTFANCVNFIQILNGYHHDKINIKGEYEKFSEKINQGYDNNYFAATHKNIVTGLAHTSITAPLVGSSLISLGLDSVSITLRSIQASVSDILDLTKDDLPVYEALTNCIKSLSEIKKSDESIHQSLDNLNALIDALVDSKDLGKQIYDRADTGSIPTIKLASLASAASISALKSLVLSLATFVHVTEAAKREKGKDQNKDKFDLAKTAKQASDDHAGTHSKNVSDLCTLFTQINEALGGVQPSASLVEEQANEVKQQQQFGPSEQSMIASGGCVSLSITTAVSVIPYLIAGLVGVITREASEITHSAKESKSSKNSIAITNIENNGKGIKSDKLFSQVIATITALEALERGNSILIPTDLTKVSTLGPLVSVLSLITGLYQGLSHGKEFSKAHSEKIEFDKKGEENNRLSFFQSIKQSNQSISKGISTDAAPKEIKSADSALDNLLAKMMLMPRVSHIPVSAQPRDEKMNSAGDILDRSSVGTAETTSVNTLAFLTGVSASTALVTLETGTIPPSALFLSIYNAMRLLTDASKTYQELSQGPDQIGGTNLSFICNALRLLEQQSKGKHSVSDGIATLLSLTANVGELTASRSIWIALTQSGVLKNALNQLTNNEIEIENAPSLLATHLKTVASAEKEVFDLLAAEIEKALANKPKEQENKGSQGNNVSGSYNPDSDPLVSDNVENVGNNEDDAPAEKKADHFVDGLNKTVASELEIASQTTIVSTLMTNSTVILPCVRTYLAILHGSESNQDEYKKDFRRSTNPISKAFSEGLDKIQNFLIECKAPENEDEDKEGLLSTHASTAAGTDRTLSMTVTLSLLLETLVETTFSRYLTLLDSKKITDISQKTTQLSKEEITDHSHASAIRLTDKSHVENSELRSLTDMPLTSRSVISEISAVMVECSGQLEKFCKQLAEAHVLQEAKDAPKMHSIEISLLKNLSSAFTQCATLLTRTLKSTALTTIAPIALRNSVHDTKEIVRACDQQLQSQEIHSSERFIEDELKHSSQHDFIESQTLSIKTANIVDLLVSAVSNLFVSILKFGVSSCDTLLSLLKIMQLSAYEDDIPRALTHETRASLLPQQGTAATTQLPHDIALTLSAILSITAAAGSAPHEPDHACIQTLKNTSLNGIQSILNQSIEGIQRLKDDEEPDVEDNKEVPADSKTVIGLKKYYKQILITITEMNKPNDETLNQLVTRLDRGGFAISEYHKDYCNRIKKRFSTEENPEDYKDQNTIYLEETIGNEESYESDSITVRWYENGKLIEPKNIALPHTIKPYFTRSDTIETKDEHFNKVKSLCGYSPILEPIPHTLRDVNNDSGVLGKFINIILDSQNPIEAFDQFYKNNIQSAAQLTEKAIVLHNEIVYQIADQLNQKMNPIGRTLYQKTGTRVFDKQAFINHYQKTPHVEIEKKEQQIPQEEEKLLLPKKSTKRSSEQKENPTEVEMVIYKPPYKEDPNTVKQNNLYERIWTNRQKRTRDLEELTSPKTNYVSPKL